MRYREGKLPLDIGEQPRAERLLRPRGWRARRRRRADRGSDHAGRIDRVDVEVSVEAQRMTEHERERSLDAGARDLAVERIEAEPIAVDRQPRRERGRHRGRWIAARRARIGRREA